MTLNRITITRENEGRCCDAIVRIVEKRLRGERKAVTRPELVHGSPPVELAFWIGEKLFALEHTKIEAFPGQIRLDRQFAEFIRPLEEYFRTPRPIQGLVSVLFPLDMTLGRDLAAAQREVIAQLESTIRRMATEVPAVAGKNVKPFGQEQREEIVVASKRIVVIRSLHWSQGRRHGNVVFSRYGVTELEDQRELRIQTAFNRKLGKLKKWKARGATSLLILEHDDIALTNSSLVGDAIEALLPGRDDVPDEIYLVETIHNEDWSVHCILRGGRLWPDVELDDHYAEFRKSDLLNLTAEPNQVGCPPTLTRPTAVTSTIDE